MASIDLPYVQEKTNSQGRKYWFYRRNGRYVRLEGEPGSSEWLKTYWKERKLDDNKLEEQKADPAQKRTLKQLSIQYYASSAFKKNKPSTQRAYRSNIQANLIEPHGNLLVSGMKFRHVNKLIGDMVDRPGAANNALKRLREMFKLAKRLEWAKADPTEGVEFYKLGEIHTWTDAEIIQFCDYWKPGTIQRLALMLQLYTGQRNSDVVMEPWPQEGAIRVTQEKTGTHLWIPVLPELQAELDLHPIKHTMIMATKYGRPRSAKGYGNLMSDAIDKAGLPARCVAHGLRKAAAKQLAEAGCTANEIMSITGHKTLSEVERYTRAAEQERLARQASEKRNANRRLGTSVIRTGNDPKAEDGSTA